MDEEGIKINLRPYLELLMRKWQFFVVPTLVVTVSALMLSLLIPQSYEARVFVAVSKQKVEVQFGTQIQTFSEEQITMNSTQAQVNREARLATFRELVANPAIGEKVLPKFADRLRILDKDLLDTSVFIADHVSVDQNTKSDLIGIVITLQDPVLAADIANAWAQAYEEHINSLYSSAQPMDAQAVRSQTEQSQQAYAAIQKELEAYLSNNPAPRVQNQINILQAQIGSYQTAILESETLVNSGELTARREILGEYYADLVILESALTDARLLQKQVLNGETSSSAAFGDSLAMIFLRSSTTDQSAPPFSLQLQTPLTTGPVSASDVSGLILALEQRKQETESAIADQTKALLDLPNYQLPQEAGAQIKARVEEWTVELQSLQAQLESETAHRKDLERQRDLAWSTYSQLASKTVEVEVAVESGGTDVRVASQSLPPSEPVHSGKLQTIFLAGLGTLVLCILVIFSIEWWQKGMQDHNRESVE